MKNIIDIYNVNIPNSLHSLYEASILGDIEDNIKHGDNFANLQDWIDNFKNLSAMDANISNFIKEIKKHGAKPLHNDAVENGKYFVEIIKTDNVNAFVRSLKFYYPDKKEDSVWNYAIIRMTIPKHKLAEQRGYKKGIIFFASEIYKSSISYLKQEVAKHISSRTHKLYNLPDKYKGIINLIKIEEKNNEI